jgi:hypothetical protein
LDNGRSERSDSGGDAAIACLVKRLSGEYVLRAFQLLSDNYGDVRTALVVRTIHTANTGHLDARTEAGRRVAGPDGMLPDELRRPISISRLAESTGLPFESTRRIVHGLIRDGHCARMQDGLIVPGAALVTPDQAHIVIANLAYVRRFVRDLQAAGLVDEAAMGWMRVGRLVNEDALARSVARVTADYFLRALRIIAEAYGDIRAGLIAQTIVVANTAHLDARAGDGRQYAGIDQPVPDAVRRPIRVSRLADSLGQPFENVRRQVQHLITAGICRRIDGGVIVPAAVLEGPVAERAMLSNVTQVRELIRDLAGLGASLATDPPIGADNSLARDQKLGRIATLLEAEQSPDVRDALRRQLIAEEDRYGSRTQRLHAAERFIATSEDRVAYAVRQLRALADSATNAAHVREQERVVANMREIVTIASEYRRVLVESLDRSGI